MPYTFEAFGQTITISQGGAAGRYFVTVNGRTRRNGFKTEAKASLAGRHEAFNIAVPLQPGSGAEAFAARRAACEDAMRRTRTLHVKAREHARIDRMPVQSIGGDALN